MTTDEIERTREINLNFLEYMAIKVAVNVSGGEQTFPQIMADFSLFVH